MYCLIYVLPLYASASTRAAAGRPRDAPDAIRARIRAVSLSTTFCSAATFALIWNSSSANQVSPWHLMGYWPLGVYDSCKTLLLTSLLFAGPLYECLIVDGVWESWIRLEPVSQLWTDWPMWRNMVAVRIPFIQDIKHHGHFNLCLHSTSLGARY